MNFEKLATMSAVTVLALSMATSVSAQEEKYVQDGSGVAVRDGSGKCVLGAIGNMLEGCGVPVAAPIKVVPVYVPPPAPMPKPRPAPIVKVLNLNESGGSNFAFERANLTDKARSQYPVL